MCYELDVAKYEDARNKAITAYFEARPSLEQSSTNEKLVEAGFRLGWEAAIKEQENV